MCEHAGHTCLCAEYGLMPNPDKFMLAAAWLVCCCCCCCQCCVLAVGLGWCVRDCAVARPRSHAVQALPQARHRHSAAGALTVPARFQPARACAPTTGVVRAKPAAASLIHNSYGRFFGHCLRCCCRRWSCGRMSQSRRERRHRTTTKQQSALCLAATRTAASEGAA